MAIAKLTIIGIHNYNKTLWDGLIVPESLDRETVINTILFNCGEFPLIHPDGIFMQLMIGEWSKKWQRSFERWAQAFTVDYNMLYNVDVSINITDELKATGSGQSEATNRVSAFDSSNFENKDQMTGNSSSTSESKNVHSEDRHGNQGMTKSTELVASEIDLRRWNVYNEIADCFAKEFCIPVYD